jgi:Tol biopolymer transport system component
MNTKVRITLIIALALWGTLAWAAHGNGPRVSAALEGTQGNDALLYAHAWDGPRNTTRVSIASDVIQGDSISGSPAISADGRYVAFESSASSLVNGDTNGFTDVFVRDRQTGVTTRVSVTSDGTQGNGSSYAPAISADGRYVAFESSASNLVSGDTNGFGDVFVRDRQTGVTTRVSVASDGTQGDSGSYAPAVSADGRYVAFASPASNLVSGDTNGFGDVFVHDRQTGVTTRVSVASDGTQGNDGPWAPAISADGRYVAFASCASNLVSGDTNGSDDVFVHDRQMGVTTRVSVASDGTQGNDDSIDAPAISADGRYVAFQSFASNLVSGDTNGFYEDVFVHDRQTGSTARVSVASDGTQGDNASLSPTISADGRYVAFDSRASNLVSEDTSGFGDVFVHDRQTGATTHVSVASDGMQGDNASGSPAISADGRYVAFDSWAGNLVSGDTNGFGDVFAHDRHTGATARVSVASDGTQGDNSSGSPAISADGRYVTFSSFASNLVSGDTNEARDVFVHDRQTDVTTRVSVASDGTQGNNASRSPAISADGRYVAFASSASNLVGGDTNGFCDVFVRDRQTGVTTRVSVASDGTQGDNASGSPAISADGRYVAFESWAGSLVSGDTNEAYDVFVHDRQTGVTTRVSVASDGTQGNGSSYGPAISADGRYVAFASFADSLVSGDTNGVGDVFVHDRQTDVTTRISVASDGTQGNDYSYYPAISADGRYVAFNSSASSLVSGDTNGDSDVFVHDRQTDVTTRASVASDGMQGNGSSKFPAISADGRYVAFDSWADNLVSGDTNATYDVFVHDRQTGDATRVSVASDGTQGNGSSESPAISADGRYVAFESSASNLVSGDTNEVRDIFVNGSINVYLPLVLRGH